MLEERSRVKDERNCVTGTFWGVAEKEVTSQTQVQVKQSPHDEHRVPPDPALIQD